MFNDVVPLFVSKYLAGNVLEVFEASTGDIHELRQVQKFSRFEGYDHVVLIFASIKFNFICCELRQRQRQEGL